MLARITMGAIGGYMLTLVITALAVSGQTSFGTAFVLDAIVFGKSSFQPVLSIPTFIGALGGYCWYHISNESLS